MSSALSLSQQDHATGSPLSAPNLAFPPPPKPILIATPSTGATAGGYPLVLLLPGFNLRNGDSKQLAEQVASHGYIVAAPQVHFLLWQLLCHL